MRCTSLATTTIVLDRNNELDADQPKGEHRAPAGGARRAPPLFARRRAGDRFAASPTYASRARHSRKTLARASAVIEGAKVGDRAASSCEPNGVEATQCGLKCSISAWISKGAKAWRPCLGPTRRARAQPPPWAKSPRSARHRSAKRRLTRRALGADPAEFPSGCDHHGLPARPARPVRPTRPSMETDPTHSPAAPPARSLHRYEKTRTFDVAVHRDRRRRARRAGPIQLRRARHRAPRSAWRCRDRALSAAASAHSAPARRRRRAARRRRQRCGARRRRKRGEARARGAEAEAATAAAVNVERRRVEAAAEAAAQAAAAVAAATHARSIVDRSTVVARLDLDARHAPRPPPARSGRRRRRPRPAARTLPPCRSPSPSASSSSDRSGGSSGRRRAAGAARPAGGGRQLPGRRRRRELGVFVACGAERDGLIHVSEPRGAPPPELGRRIDCYVQRVDLRQGRLSLTLHPPPPPPPPPPPRWSPPPAPPPALTRSFALADFALVATTPTAAPRRAPRRGRRQFAPAPRRRRRTRRRCGRWRRVVDAEAIEWVAPVTEEEIPPHATCSRRAPSAAARRATRRRHDGPDRPRVAHRSAAARTLAA